MALRFKIQIDDKGTATIQHIYKTIKGMEESKRPPVIIQTDPVKLKRFRKKWL